VAPSPARNNRVKESMKSTAKFQTLTKNEIGNRLTTSTAKSKYKHAIISENEPVRESDKPTARKDIKFSERGSDLAQ
jgi:hypothetical protein